MVYYSFRLGEVILVVIIIIIFLFFLLFFFFTAPFINILLKTRPSDTVFLVSEIVKEPFRQTRANRILPHGFRFLVVWMLLAGMPKTSIE